MDRAAVRRIGMLALVFVGIWLGIRYLLPILMPFLLGLGLALLVEPMVKLLHSRFRLPRAFASALALSGGLVMIFGALWILGAAAYRELTELAGSLPSFFEGIAGTAETVRDWSLELAARVPDGLSQPLGNWLRNLFADGSVLLERAASTALGVIGNVMGGIPGGALLLGTAVISSFMISAQLPNLKERLKGKMSAQWMKKTVQTFQKIRQAVGGWLRAQVKLSGVTLLIVGAGLMILRVEHVIFWAVIIALVDAVPLLGTGTVLIPWCLLSFIQGDSVRAIGLLGIYVTAVMTRSVLEPKLVGGQLGMNPLLTLVVLYAGYRLWGVMGMIFAPILTVTVKQLTTLRE